MKILVDENIPRMTVTALTGQGHDVLDFRGSSQEGAPDANLWNIALRENRLLITTDKGFAAHRRENHAGVLIVRLRQPNRKRIHDRALLAFSRFQEAQWQGLTVVIRDQAISFWRFNPTQP
jgi:predicted nuclease of predicted toxin-antitoxin system